jgi:flagellar protein FlaG
MTVGALQFALPGETEGTERPAAQNSDARPPSQRVQQPVTEVKTQAKLPSPAEPSQLTLAYHVDDRTRQIYFQIVDSQSGQVIRQVPPAEVLALEARITELLAAANAKQAKSQERGA